ncbi:MAG: 50S ribosomal protein L5 [Opitutales bacterium]
MADSQLKKHYSEQVVPELMKQLGLTNKHQVPALQKIVINSGFSATEDKGTINDITRDLGAITGQRPIITKARLSISNFKLRAGMPIGAKVTLRGDRMWEFLYRLMNLALPAIRDFRGVPAKLDGQGNYTLGITDHTIFPEISVDGQKRTTGMDVTLVTSARDDATGKLLLDLLGMPFRKPARAAEAQA